MDKKEPSPSLLGVDTGGTFTDLVLVQDGSVRTHKVASTPQDPSEAVLRGIAELGGDCSLVFHGSTVATNALLEGKGARVALVTTEGFADVLFIGRQNRPDLYALHPVHHRTLLPRESVVEVRERILADGSVELPLSVEEVERVVARVKATGCPSVALCLLHSYANPDHEAVLADALNREGLEVSASHLILREYREFERTSTTTVNASISPVMDRYLRRLQAGLEDSALKIMQSNGGSISARVAGVEGVRTILSGPAGGMVGAFAHAEEGGYDKVLTFDMGGTSTDVGLCDESIPMTTDTEIAGWPVRVPMIDIHTVGAGGGSIARLDAGGALRVGPESAGADPGPVCYGRGEAVTVTDANLFLGRLLPDRFLGGRMALHAQRCRLAIEELATRAGLTPEALAEGVLEVAEDTMVAALRLVSVERGYDPREFVLLPFGGAGGLHACSLAQRLGMKKVLVPVNPGLLSAVGMVRSDSIRDYSQSMMIRGARARADLLGRYSDMKERAALDMADEGIEMASLQYQLAVDMRYVGQSFELTVPLDDDYLDQFHRQHQQRYGYLDESREVELVTLRLRAVGEGVSPLFATPLAKSGKAVSNSQVAVICQGETMECPVYERVELGVEQQVEGPALIVEETSTHWIAPAWKARCDALGHLVLEREES